MRIPDFGLRYPLLLELAGMSDVGCRRTHNEDAFIADGRGVFGVADGMGGLNAGEVASAAVRSHLWDLAEQAGDFSDFTSQNVMSTLLAAHNELRDLAREKNWINEKGRAEIGCTASVLLINRRLRTGIVGHVGDSRVYRLRAGELSQLTTDHSYEAEIRKGLERKGLPSDDSAVNLKMIAGKITRAVGLSSELEPEIRKIDVCQDDQFLICSDGLNRHVSDQEIKNILIENSGVSADEVAEELIELTKSRGARDNVSIVLVRVKDDITARRHRRKNVGYAAVLGLVLFVISGIGFHGVRSHLRNRSVSITINEYFQRMRQDVSVTEEELRLLHALTNAIENEKRPTVRHEVDPFIRERIKVFLDNYQERSRYYLADRDWSALEGMPALDQGLFADYNVDYLIVFSERKNELRGGWLGLREALNTQNSPMTFNKAGFLAEIIEPLLPNDPLIRFSEFKLDKLDSRKGMEELLVLWPFGRLMNDIKGRYEEKWLVKTIEEHGIVETWRQVITGIEPYTKIGNDAFKLLSEVTGKWLREAENEFRKGDNRKAAAEIYLRLEELYRLDVPESAPFPREEISELLSSVRERSVEVFLVDIEEYGIIETWRQVISGREPYFTDVDDHDYREMASETKERLREAGDKAMADDREAAGKVIQQLEELRKFNFPESVAFLEEEISSLLTSLQRQPFEVFVADIEEYGIIEAWRQVIAGREPYFTHVDDHDYRQMTAETMKRLREKGRKGLTDPEAAEKLIAVFSALNEMPFPASVDLSKNEKREIIWPVLNKYADFFRDCFNKAYAETGEWGEMAILLEKTPLIFQKLSENNEIVDAARDWVSLAQDENRQKELAGRLVSLKSIVTSISVGETLSFDSVFAMREGHQISEKIDALNAALDTIVKTLENHFSIISPSQVEHLFNVIYARDEDELNRRLGEAEQLRKSVSEMRKAEGFTREQQETNSRIESLEIGSSYLSPEKRVGKLEKKVREVEKARKSAERFIGVLRSALDKNFRNSTRGQVSRSFSVRGDSFLQYDYKEILKFPLTSENLDLCKENFNRILNRLPD